jgi:hypothetical protein
MGWTTSIHVQTSDIEKVITALSILNERGSFVGLSGPNWVGVWSQGCERSGGLRTPELARQLSQRLDDHIFGLTNGEEGFAYWLLRQDRMLDRYPPSRLKRALGSHRAVLDLCIRAPDRDRVEAMFKPKRRLRPHEASGMTEEEFIAQAHRDIARVQSMSPEELQNMSAKYGRLRNSSEADLEILCVALGIAEWSWVHSDFRSERPGAGPGIQIREV